MKDKKGFTLIELMAVIVILAVLSAIIIPKIVSTIKNSKVNSYRVSVDNLVKELNNLALDKKANLLPFNGCTMNFDTATNTCTDLEYSGMLPDSGSLIVDKDGNVNGSAGYDDFYTNIENNAIKESYVLGFVKNFDYIGGEMTLNITEDGYYKLEVWGASGGNATSTYKGGYGSYSVGVVELEKGDTLYINVGGQGGTSSTKNVPAKGGYNGGGSSLNNVDGCGDFYVGGGGGATHIALQSGTLASFDFDGDGHADSEELLYLLIVAGGGGGSNYCNGWNYGSGGHGGGYAGNEAYNLGPDAISGNGHGTGGTQTAGGSTYRGSGLTNPSSFGASKEISSNRVGGGGGFYAGGIGNLGSGGGGSGYIGNPYLYECSMYCYDCGESPMDGILTISTTGTNNLRDTVNCPVGYSADAVGKCAKSGNGYARVTQYKDYSSKDID